MCRNLVQSNKQYSLFYYVNITETLTRRLTDRQYHDKGKKTKRQAIIYIRLHYSKQYEMVGRKKSESHQN